MRAVRLSMSRSAKKNRKRCEKGLPTRIFCCSLKLNMKQTPRRNDTAKERRLQSSFAVEYGFEAAGRVAGTAKKRDVYTTFLHTAQTGGRCSG